MVIEIEPGQGLHINRRIENLARTGQDDKQGACGSVGISLCCAPHQTRLDNEAQTQSEILGCQCAAAIYPTMMLTLTLVFA